MIWEKVLPKIHKVFIFLNFFFPLKAFERQYRGYQNTGCGKRNWNQDQTGQGYKLKTTYKERKEIISPEEEHLSYQMGYSHTDVGNCFVSTSGGTTWVQSEFQLLEKGLSLMVAGLNIKHNWVNECVYPIYTFFYSSILEFQLRGDSLKYEWWGQNGV